MFGVEEWSLQHIFSLNLAAKQAKTPHVALMSHPSTTTIYFGTDNFTKTYSTSTGQHVDAQLFNQFTKGLFMSFTFHSLNSWQGDEELRRYTLFTSPPMLDSTELHVDAQ